MSKVRDRLSERSQVKRIYMSCGRLPIDSAGYEWINPNTRVKKPGTVLDAGENGYVELDLRVEKDAELYERFQKWIADGTDDRIVSQNVHELGEGEVKPPFTWWDKTKETDLIKDVLRGVEAMDEQSSRESFIEQCVLYEQQRGDKCRRRLVERLLDLDLEPVSDDPMNPTIKVDDE